jgi:hypothetical protein
MQTPFVGNGSHVTPPFRRSGRPFGIGSGSVFGNVTAEAVAVNERADRAVPRRERIRSGETTKREGGPMTGGQETAPATIDLGAAPWAPEAPGIDSRTGELEGVRWALVRYAAGAERDEWCTDGHRGYVLSGGISYELADGSRLDVGNGAGFWLPPGLGHRGVNGTVETRLFLIDVPDEEAAAP